MSTKYQNHLTKKSIKQDQLRKKIGFVKNFSQKLSRNGEQTTRIDYIRHESSQGGKIAQRNQQNDLNTRK